MVEIKVGTRDKVRGPYSPGDGEVFTPEDPAWQARVGTPRGEVRSQPREKVGREFQAETAASLG